jgi:hypothetical protein
MGNKRALAFFVLLVGSVGDLGCNTPADIRLHCLRMAHRAVKEQPNQEAYKEMVQEYYLRCLEAEGVRDAPVK